MKTNTKYNANKKDFIDLPRKGPRSVSNGNRNDNQSDAFKRLISKYSGLERTYDEYDRYEDTLDANANEYLAIQDSSIIRSEIMITDPAGRNRTLVRRNR